jgi:hypothetical protein
MVIRQRPHPSIHPGHPSRPSIDGIGFRTDRNEGTREWRVRTLYVGLLAAAM